MHADDMRFSIPAVWEPFYRELCSTQWERDDINDLMHGRNPDTLAAANTLGYVWRYVSEHWKGKFEIEDGVLATLKAAQQHHGGTFLAPGQVKEMAAHFAVHYPNWLEPFEDYLDENCGPVGWHWLSDHGQREIEKAVIKDSELWIRDVNVSDDVWVFNKPGHTT